MINTITISLLQELILPSLLIILLGFHLGA